MLTIDVCCVSAPSRGLCLGCCKAEILVGCYLRRVSLVWVFWFWWFWHFGFVSACIGQRLVFGFAFSICCWCFGGLVFGAGVLLVGRL